MNLLSGAHRAAFPARPLRMALLTLLLCLPLLLMACAGTLLPKPAAPPARFALSAGPASATAATTPRPAAIGAPSLTVELPRAAPGYDSRRMLYQRRPQQLEAFAFNEWVEPPAQMLAPMLVRALQGSGAFGAVLQAPSAVTTGWRLETELVRLHQDFGQRPSQAQLSLRAVLLNNRTREALAWREFNISVNATGEDPVAGAAAAQEAAMQLAAAVAAFCAEQPLPAAR
jgi:cholesterol transport system auxiliary component